MDLTPIVQRIRAQVAAYRVVDFALTFDALKARGVPQLPAAFAMPVSERSGPNRLSTGAFEQRTDGVFAVYSFVKSVRAELGADTHDALAAVRGPLFDALCGWAPSPSFDLIEHRDGAIVSLNDGILTWRDTFTLNTQYRRIG